MKKIAFVCQRYGQEVAGGAESYTRQMAEHLAAWNMKQQKQNGNVEHQEQNGNAEHQELNGNAEQHGHLEQNGNVEQDYEIEVLTSKAVDFQTWADYYQADTEKLKGVTVHRFSVTKGRNPFIQRGFGILMHRFGIHFHWMEEMRLKARGPYCPGLVSYIKEHKDDYDAFFFVTYMYYPAYFGAREVYEKAYFIPTAHDEEPIYMNLFHELFRRVRGITYLTQEEKDFVERTFHNEAVPNQVIGMGIEVPANASGERFREKYNIKGDYLVFAGRIEEGKGCKELMDYFIQYQEEQHKLTLVLMGKATMEIPEREDIRYVGFVSEADKYDGMKGAKVICLPSRHESFSISLLEGMAYGNPALVNGACEVLKGHMDRSGGGLCYTDYTDFKENLGKLLNRSEEMGKAAAAYVEKNYSWNAVISQFMGQL